MATSKEVFVIMPFSSTHSCTESEWTDVFENVFQPAIEVCGYSCHESTPNTGSLICSIIEQLKNAWIVLADITDRNPNVFYELGVRHSLSNRTIIVSQNTEDIPSDLRGYWSIQYRLRPREVINFKKDISRIIIEIDANPNKCDSPVSDYLERENIDISRFVQKENIKKIAALYTELNGNYLALKSILTNENKSYSPYYISTESIKLLLNTRYIDPGPEVLKYAYELVRDLDYVCSEEVSNKHAEHGLMLCVKLTESIDVIKERLYRGEYLEPSIASIMVWEESLDDNLNDKKTVDCLSCYKILET